MEISWNILQLFLFQVKQSHSSSSTSSTKLIQNSFIHTSFIYFSICKLHKGLIKNSPIYFLMDNCLGILKSGQKKNCLFIIFLENIFFSSYDVSRTYLVLYKEIPITCYVPNLLKILIPPSMYIVFISIIGDGGNQIEAKIDRPFVLPGS